MHALLKKLHVSTLLDFKYSLLSFVARFSVAGVFWKSGQTKISGFELDIVNQHFMLGAVSLSDTTLELFKEEYKLPLVPYEFAAYSASIAEHILPALLLLGIASRFSALGLLLMTLVIQLFVYPSAYTLHGLWATSLLLIIFYGPGKLSLDYLIAKKYQA